MKSIHTNAELHSLSLDALRELRAKIDSEITNRPCEINLVEASLSIRAGNRRAGAKSWVREPKGLDPVKGDAYGINGDYVCEVDRYDPCGNYSVFRPEGTLWVARAVGGSYKNRTSLCHVLKLKAGAKLEVESGYQRLSGTGVEVLSMLGSRIKMLERFPELATVKAEWFEVYAILRSEGVPLADASQNLTK